MGFNSGFKGLMLDLFKITVLYCEEETKPPDAHHFMAAK